MLVDEVDVLMRRLNTLDREVLSRRLQGDEQSAIAQALGCSERTVRRSLTTIRQLVKEQEAAGNVIKLPSDVVEANAATSGSLPRHKRGSGSEPSRNQYLPSIAYDSFVLRHLVGLGGFGKVYRATRKVDEKTVAVKFLRKRFWKDRQATRAFLTETNALATLKHPNIIECQGSGIAPGGGAFLVMEWIDGCNASAWRRNSALSIADVIRCGIAMAEALATAHAAGIVHGDVAPGNVLLRPDGMFVLTDFGFARSMIDGMPEIGGTPGFLAPEQVCEDFGRIGPRTDIYGLGGILYFLLTGDPPVRGTDVPEILANVLSSWSSRPENSFGADVPAELSQLVGDCLQKEVAARPQSMDDVCRRLVERRS
jgi:serine/threonine protein kinase